MNQLCWGSKVARRTGFEPVLQLINSQSAYQLAYLRMSFLRLVLITVFSDPEAFINFMHAIVERD